MFNDENKNKKINRIDELVNRLQKENKINMLESELLKFEPTSLSDFEKES